MKNLCNTSMGRDFLNFMIQHLAIGNSRSGKCNNLEMLVSSTGGRLAFDLTLVSKHYIVRDVPLYDLTYGIKGVINPRELSPESIKFCVKVRDQELCVSLKEILVLLGWTYTVMQDDAKAVKGIEAEPAAKNAMEAMVAMFRKSAKQKPPKGKE